MQKSGGTKNLIFSILSLVLALTLLTAACFAWFPPAGYNKTFTVTSGDLKLNCAVYLGNDADKDGRLESADGSNPIGRSKRLKAFYAPLDRENFTVHGNFIQGNCLTFKLIVENAGAVSGNAALSLADMGDYLLNGVQNFAANGTLTADGDARQIFDYKAGRTVFEMADIVVNVYKAGDTEDSIESGYETLTRTSDPSAISDETTFLEAPPDRPLWEISAGEKFATVSLGARELLELDFRLFNRQIDKELTDAYLTYLKGNLSDIVGDLLAGYGSTRTAEEYIDLLVQEETNYLLGVGYEDEVRMNGFSIAKIYIEGTQTYENG